MIFDLGAVALVGILAAVGGTVGLLVQLVRLAAPIVAAIVAAPLGALLRDRVGTLTGLGEIAAGFWTTSTVFLLVALCTRWIGGTIARRLTTDDEDRAVDRGTGALLGAAKGLVAAWLVAVAWIHVEHLAGRHLGTEDSFVVATARWIGWLLPG